MSTPSQTAINWAKLFGSPNGADRANGLAVASDGSLYVTGWLFGYPFQSIDGQAYGGNGDVFLAKYEQNGTRSWLKLIATPGTEEAAAIVTTKQGNVLIAGRTTDGFAGLSTSGNHDAFLMKLNEDGEIHWTTLVGSQGEDRIYSLAADQFENIYVGGYLAGSIDGQQNSGHPDAFVSKYSPIGERLWTRFVASNGAVNAVIVSSQGEVFVTGSTASGIGGQASSNGSDAFLAKFSPLGEKLWSVQYDLGGYESPSSICLGRNGEILIAVNLLVGDQSELLVLKVDRDGKMIWSKEFQLGSDKTHSTAIAASTDGSATVTGWTRTGFDSLGNSLDDGFVLQLDESGERIRTTLVGNSTSSVERINALATGTAGTIYLAGSATENFFNQTNSGYQDVLIASYNLPTKFDTTYSVIHFGPNVYPPQDVDVAVLENGNWVVVWNSYGDPDSSSGVYFQVFDKTGTAITEIRRAHDNYIGAQFQHTAVGLEDGGFAIAWTGSLGGVGRDIYASIFNNTGSVIASEIQVNLELAGEQSNPQILSLSSGNIVIGWDEAKFQVFSASGGRVGNTKGYSLPSTYATYSPPANPEALLATSDGGFLGFWTKEGPPNSSGVKTYGLSAQKYNASGDKVGGEITVVPAKAYASFPDLKAVTSGSTNLVAWYDHLTKSVSAIKIDSAGLIDANVISIQTMQTYSGFELGGRPEEGWTIISRQDVGGVLKYDFDVNGKSLGQPIKFDAPGTDSYPSSSNNNAISVVTWVTPDMSPFLHSVVLDSNPSYTITPSATSVNEGSSVTFTIDTKNVEWGTEISFKLIGVDVSDVDDDGPRLEGRALVYPPGRPSQINLDARKPIVPNTKVVAGAEGGVGPNDLDVNDPLTYSHVQQLEIYDKDGQVHVLFLYFRRVDENYYNIYVNVDGQVFAAEFQDSCIKIQMPSKLADTEADAEPADVPKAIASFGFFEGKLVRVGAALEADAEPEELTEDAGNLSLEFRIEPPEGEPVDPSRLLSEPIQFVFDFSGTTKYAADFLGGLPSLQEDVVWLLPPNPTVRPTASFNLDARKSIVPNTKVVAGAEGGVGPNDLDVNDPLTYSHVQQLEIYDKDGQVHVLFLYFRRVDENYYNIYVNVDGQVFAAEFQDSCIKIQMPSKLADTEADAEPADVPKAIASFGFFEGKLVRVGAALEADAEPEELTEDAGNLSLEFRIEPPEGEPVDPSRLLSEPIQFVFDFSGTTKYATSFELTKFVQDGYLPRWVGDSDRGLAIVRIPISEDQTTEGVESLRLTVESTTSSAVTVNDTSVNSTPQYNSASEHYYQFISASSYSARTQYVTNQFSQAQSQAEGVSHRGLYGYLATITSSSENQFVSTLVGSQAAYIGGSDRVSAGEWKWISGPEAGQSIGGAGKYTNWYPGEPSNNGFVGSVWGEGIENALAISGDSIKWQGRWWDTGEWFAPGVENYGYVVEYGGMPATYTITPSATSVNEGSSVTFTIDTKNVEWGKTISYSLTGISQADLASGSLTGTATVNQNGVDGRATVTVELAQDDLNEGEETLTLSLGDSTTFTTVQDTSRTLEGLSNASVLDDAQLLVGTIVGVTNDITPTVRVELSSPLSTGLYGSDEYIAVYRGSDPADLSISNLLASGVGGGSGDTPNVRTLSLPTLSGSVSLWVRIEDTAGNVGPAYVIPSFFIDAVAPTISITSDLASLKAGQAATVAFTLSEPSSDFTAADVIVSGGTLSNFQGSGNSYSARFTPITNSPAQTSVTVTSGAFSDAAGNQNTDGSDADNTYQFLLERVYYFAEDSVANLQLPPGTKDPRYITPYVVFDVAYLDNNGTVTSERSDWQRVDVSQNGSLTLQPFLNFNGLLSSETTSGPLKIFFTPMPDPIGLVTSEPGVFVGSSSGSVWFRDINQRTDGSYAGVGSTHDGWKASELSESGLLNKTYATQSATFLTNISAFDSALQADNRLLVAGIEQYNNIVSSQNRGSIVRLLSDGAIDTSFGVNGYVYAPAWGELDRPFSWFQAVAVQADQKIVAVGRARKGNGGFDVGVLRLNPDGSLDPSFDTDGWRTIDLGAFDDRGRAIEFQPDGKIVIAGWSSQYGNSDLAMIRLSDTGELDGSFGQGGVNVISLPNSADFLYSAFERQSDGKFLLGGSSQDITSIGDATSSIGPTISGVGKGLVVRVNADGSLDTSFANAGVLRFDLPGIVNPLELTVTRIYQRPDGRLILSGRAYEGDWANNLVAHTFVMQLLSDGSLDASFDGDGIFITEGGSSAGALDSAGRYVFNSEDSDPFVGSSSPVVFRLLPNGQIDLSFNPTPTFQPGGPAVALNHLVSIYDADAAWTEEVGPAANYAGTTVTIQRQGAASADDQFGALGSLQLQRTSAVGSSDAGTVNLGGLAIGSYEQAGGKLTLAFNASADQAKVDATLSSLSYKNVGTSAPANLQLSVTATDAQGSSDEAIIALNLATHTLGIQVGFWRSGVPLSGVTVYTLGTGEEGESLNAVKLRNASVDGSNNLRFDLWAEPLQSVSGVDLALTKPSNWLNGFTPTTLAGWTLETNQIAEGEYRYASADFAQTGATSAAFKLGTYTQPANALNAAGGDLSLSWSLTPTTGAAGPFLQNDLAMRKASANSGGVATVSGLYADSYQVLASRGAADVGRAITSADALAALKIAVGLSPNAGSAPVTVAQFAAADVDGSGAVNSADALNVLKMAVGLSTAPSSGWLWFTQAMSTSYVTKTTHDWQKSMIVPIEASQTLQLVGVLRGDVDGSWTPPPSG